MLNGWSVELNSWPSELSPKHGETVKQKLIISLIPRNTGECCPQYLLRGTRLRRIFNIEAVRRFVKTYTNVRSYFFIIVDSIAKPRVIFNVAVRPSISGSSGTVSGSE